METIFWRIAEDARISAQARDAKLEIMEMADRAKDEISIKVGWMIRSDGQRRRYKTKAQEITK